MLALNLFYLFLRIIYEVVFLSFILSIINVEVIMFSNTCKLSLGLSLASAALIGTMAFPAYASSHREAPFITQMPKVDGTDFYMFRMLNCTQN